MKLLSDSSIVPPQPMSLRQGSTMSNCQVSQTDAMSDAAILLTNFVDFGLKWSVQCPYPCWVSSPQNGYLRQNEESKSNIVQSYKRINKSSTVPEVDPTSIPSTLHPKFTMVALIPSKPLQNKKTHFGQGAHNSRILHTGHFFLS